jgi:uncharacterized protein (TIGR03437 family)
MNKYFPAAIASFFLIFSVGQAQTVQSVLNAASYTTIVAPGTWVAIFGTQLAVTAASATSAPFATNLNNVSVTVAGLAAPISYVSPTQVNALIPFEAATLALGQTVVVPVVVSTAAGISPAFSITLRRNAPAIYTKDLSGSGAALAFDANFKPLSVVGSGAIVLYATGLGPTHPPAATGALGAGAEPLSRMQDSISIRIGGSDATVLFAGMAPGLHGVYQINVLPPQFVPPQFPLGNFISISVPGASFKPVTLPVPIGTSVSNLKGSVDILSPAAQTGQTEVMNQTGVSAILDAASFTTIFDIVPGAKRFQVIASGSTGSATIDIDPSKNTWQATYTVPTAAARSGDLSALGTVLDFLTCTGASNQTCRSLPGGVLPASRIGLDWYTASRVLPLPTTTPAFSANGTFTSVGTLPPDGHFEISADALPQLSSFGGFNNFSSILHGSTRQSSVSLYVDGVFVTQKFVSYRY